MTRPAPTVTVPVEPYMGSPEALAGMTQAIVKADAEFGHELSAYRYRTLAQAAFDTVFVGLSAALRAQPQAREDAQPVISAGRVLADALRQYGFPVSGGAKAALSDHGSAEALALNEACVAFLAALQDEQKGGA